VRDPRRPLPPRKGRRRWRSSRALPSPNRPAIFLDTIRQASDEAMHAARVDQKFETEQRRLGEWRLMLANTMEQNDYQRTVSTNAGGRRRRRKSA